MVHQSAHNANHEVDNASNLKLPFPAKLLKLLEESEKNDTTHIVAWLPTGKAFKIHDDDKFSEVVMGKYFRQSKIKSFTRQLVSCLLLHPCLILCALRPVLTGCFPFSFSIVHLWFHQNFHGTQPWRILSSKICSQQSQVLLVCGSSRWQRRPTMQAQSPGNT